MVSVGVLFEAVANGEVHRSARGLILQVCPCEASVMDVA